jgi:hypothetical protein
MTAIYQASASEITHFARIHREGLLLLPLSVGRLWQGDWLEIHCGSRLLLFRVARMSRPCRVSELAADQAAAACFSGLDVTEAAAWWQGQPHGLQSRAMLVWVWTRKGMERVKENCYANTI